MNLVSIIFTEPGIHEQFKITLQWYIAFLTIKFVTQHLHVGTPVCSPCGINHSGPYIGLSNGGFVFCRWYQARADPGQFLGGIEGKARVEGAKRPRIEGEARTEGKAQEKAGGGVWGGGSVSPSPEIFRKFELETVQFGVDTCSLYLSICLYLKLKSLWEIRAR